MDKKKDNPIRRVITFSEQTGDIMYTRPFKLFGKTIYEPEPKLLGYYYLIKGPGWESEIDMKKRGIRDCSDTGTSCMCGGYNGYLYLPNDPKKVKQIKSRILDKFDVHGGVTFQCYNELGWMLGFDTGHGWSNKVPCRDPKWVKSEIYKLLCCVMAGYKYAFSYDLACWLSECPIRLIAKIGAAWQGNIERRFELASAYYFGPSDVEFKQMTGLTPPA